MLIGDACSRRPQCFGALLRFWSRPARSQKLRRARLCFISSLSPLWSYRSDQLPWENPGIFNITPLIIACLVYQIVWVALHNVPGVVLADPALPCIASGVIYLSYATFRCHSRRNAPARADHKHPPARSGLGWHRHLSGQSPCGEPGNWLETVSIEPKWVPGDPPCL